MYTGFRLGNLGERDRRRREDNIKVDLEDVECECMDWINPT